MNHMVFGTTFLIVDDVSTSKDGRIKQPIAY